MPWTRKYRPKNSSEIQAQHKQVALIKDFLTNFKRYKKKALLLYGPTGCGKTSSVHAIANELNFEIIEVNASDYRTPDMIEKTIGAASKQMSLFGNAKVILVDEVDGISGGKDRGGIPAIAKIIVQSSFPVILTANDPYDKKFTPLRKISEIVQFDTLRYTSILQNLKTICTAENIVCKEEDLKSIARGAGGDLRGAVTDLQVLTAGSTSLSQLSLDELGGRHQTETMMTALMRILKGTDPIVAMDALNNVDEDINKSILWLDENLPVEYTKPIDLYRAYTYLAKADIFLRRIRRWQHWRYLVYANQLITAGIAVSKDEKYPGFTPYKPTTRILKLWQANMKHAKKKDIAKKIAEVTHTSSRQVMQNVLPYLKQAAYNDLAIGEAIASDCDLNKDELDWMQK